MSACGTPEQCHYYDRLSYTGCAQAGGYCPLYSPITGRKWLYPVAMSVAGLRWFHSGRFYLNAGLHPESVVGMVSSLFRWLPHTDYAAVHLYQTEPLHHRNTAHIPVSPPPADKQVASPVHEGRNHLPDVHHNQQNHATDAILLGAYKCYLQTAGSRCAILLPVPRDGFSLSDRYPRSC